MTAQVIQMAPRAVWTALSSVLAALAACTCACGGAGVNMLIFTYPKTNTLVVSVCHRGSSPGDVATQVVHTPPCGY